MQLWLLIYMQKSLKHEGGSLQSYLHLKQQWLLIYIQKSLKHEGGSLQAWLQRFDDAVEECKTTEATTTDEMKCIYLMRNLNKKILQQILVLLCGVLLTRKTFPDTFEALKAYISIEYSSQMTQCYLAKVFYAVISSQAMLDRDEVENGGTNNYIIIKDAKRENVGIMILPKHESRIRRKRKESSTKNKRPGRRSRNDEGTPTSYKNKNVDGERDVHHKGTIVRLLLKTELVGLCNITEKHACLYLLPTM